MEWLTTIIRSLTKPFQWWVVIAEWESGLLVRLGKNSRVLIPGIHLRIPFLDRIYVQSIRLRTTSFCGMQCVTKDGKTAVVGAAVSFSIGNIKELYDSSSTPEFTLETQVMQMLIARIATLDAHAIRASDLEFTVDVPKVKGLDNVTVSITSFAVCRTYRLIQNEYRTGGGMWSLDDTASNGERK